MNEIQVENSDQERILLLECNIDDMTGEALGYAMEQLLAAGALDVWFTPIYMKKNRPATLFSVLCKHEDGPSMRGMLLCETSTLGVRWQEMQRTAAERQIDTVDTPWGSVRRKLKVWNGHIISIKPEYEDCARLAREYHLPLQQVIEAALHPS